MSSRRSTRISNPDRIQEPAERQAPVENVKKRKSPASESKIKTEAKRKAAAPAVSNGNDNDLLSSLPREILDMILDELKEDLPTISRLGRASKAFYSLMMPLLYNRIAVAAMFHAHIPKLIRTLDPILTVHQKRQLKKEGKYKGQQDRYITRVDPNTMPQCASHVRQFVAGVANPGRKHNYIVYRYVEEALKNLHDLEIVEAYFITESMADSIASLKKLNSLCLHRETADPDVINRLSGIKNLKHLSVECGSYHKKDHIQSILLNSTSTLESLVLHVGRHANWILKDWVKKVSTDPIQQMQTPSFSALKSLNLTGFEFETSFAESLDRAIDFMGLHELRLGYLGSNQQLFYNHLAGLAELNSQTRQPIRLRNLRIDLTGDLIDDWEKESHLKAKCQFISSFDTLTSLELFDYNQYPETVTTNPGLSDSLLQAILNHKKLRNLKLSYNGIMSGRKIPYLSPTTVASLVENLNQLQEITFAPEEVNIKQIGIALSRAPNLTSVTCFPYDSWNGWPRLENPGMIILDGILKGFLSQVNTSTDEVFVWEKHYKLKKVIASHRKWEIASNFLKPEKPKKKSVKPLGQQVAGKGKVETIESDSNGLYVSYKDDADPFYIHIGFDPEFKWIKKVTKA